MLLATRIIASSLIALMSTLCAAQQTAAPPQESSVAEITKLKQNPVGGLRSVYLQNVNAPYGEGIANGFSIQPVWPFSVGQNWKLITYTIIPIQHFPPTAPGANSVNGLGNILFNGFFVPKQHKGIIFSGGPALQLPTRTDPALGSSRVCLGPTALIYDSIGPAAVGAVVQNYWSLGGSGSNKVNLFSLQYIFAYNITPTTYLQSNATITADWTHEQPDRWTVPVGGGIGKVFKMGKYYGSPNIQAFYNAARPTAVGAWSVIGQFQIIFSQ